MNGDGYADVIVGAYWYDNGQMNEGMVFIYHGSASGINPTAATTFESNQIEAYLGLSVAGAGDVNGDGYADVIVGAPYYDNGQTNEGMAFVHHGSAAGVSATAATIFEGNRGWATLGYVAGAGDVNGDGYADVIVGARGYSNGQSSEGAAFVYHGSTSGVNPTAVTTIESNQAFAWLGGSVAGAGDVNGDGYADVIVGAHQYDNGQIDEGAAFVYHGSASGVSATAATTLESNQAVAWLGDSVAGAGDVNGDGYADVIVGAWSYDNGEENEGAAFVYHGSASGVSPTPATTFESDQAYARLGHSVAGVGDVNGDGYADVIVGAPLYDNGSVAEGVAFVHHGSAAGVSLTAATILESNQASAYLGYSVAGAGDVNDDGFADVIVGAPYYENGQTDEGAAFVYHGSAVGVSATATATLESNQANAQFGYSVAGAGDVNGDGYADVIVGAYLYDNGQTDEGAAFVYHSSAAGISPAPATTFESNQANAQFGDSVAGAGDVNGDGYADVIVGAHFYDNGQIDEGAAFVYHGSASGVNPVAATTLENNQADARLGYSVAGAGDVNGDGYADVIVGAYLYDNGQTNEGVAFVYPGSAGGVSPTAATTVESNQAYAGLGAAVAGAGDVNGDGYADVIVGAYLYDNGQTDEGAAFVYHGSASGVNPTTATTFECDQAYARLGHNVAGAGDVNGDGYADVIVGAYRYDNGQIDEGAAFIYHGSAAGISSTVATFLESDQAYASLSRSLAGAGDVNGDGYADIIVGAWTYDNGQIDEGAAFIYYGSAGGVSPAPTTLESNQGNAQLGTSVAGAGDVNGDGFADVIVGAPLYDKGQIDEGTAFVYYGNGGSEGRPVLSRQARGDGSGILVQPWGLSHHLSQFQVQMTATSPPGRQRVKLQVQACPPGVPFGHASCIDHTSATWTDVTATAGGVSLNETLTGLMDNALYRWRARVLYAPFTVTQPGITPPPRPVHGPWRRLLGQSLEADLRVGIPPRPDLAIAKTVTPAIAQPGQTITYTLAFANVGSDIATGVVITDEVPITLTNVTSTSTGATLTPRGGTTYTWDVQDLAQNESGTITITGKVSSTLSSDTIFFNTATITTTSSTDANSANNITLPVPVTINVPKLGFDRTTYSIAEAAGTAIITVTLNPAALANATVDYATSNGSALSGPSGDYQAVNGTLTFIPGTTALTFTVPITDDNIAEPTEDLNLTLSNPSGAALLTASAVLSIADNDTPGLSLIPASGLHVTEGATKTYQVLLKTRPTASVTGTLVTDGQTNVAPNLLLFTALNWNQPQTVTVTAIDDGVTEGAHTGTITHTCTSTDPAYGGMAPLPFVVNLSDRPLQPRSSTVYLPLVLKGIKTAPDLVVERLIATNNTVTVIIKNQGNGPVVDAFWVDVYIKPTTPPTGVNQHWHNLGSQGLVWGIKGGSALPIAPGQAITLTINDAYYKPEFSHFSTPLVAPIYAQVDSVNLTPGVTYGGVLEDHEMTGGTYNNITSTFVIQSLAEPVMSSTSGTEMLSSEGLPPRYAD